MAERYFLVLLVFLTAAGSLWLSLVHPIASSSVFLAALLSLLGLVAVAYAGSARKASILMPLFFIAALAFEVYLYLNRGFGRILVSILLLALIGIILGFGISPRRKMTARKAKKAVSASAASEAKLPKKKKAAKKAKMRKKK